MKKLHLLFLVALLSQTLLAQEKEFGVFVGATAFSGDVVEGPVDFNELNLGFGALYRFYASPKFSFRIGANYGKFTGDDANATTARANRGYSFSSTIIDASISAEWNILGINVYGPSAYKQNRFSPFLLIGVGASMYDPTVTVTNSELDAFDEQQEYSQISMIVPMGVGLKYATEKVTLTLEGVVRAGLTDYLDGISKSADPDDSDWYGYYGVSAAYRIGKVSSGSAPKNMDDMPSDSEEMGSYDTDYEDYEEPVAEDYGETEYNEAGEELMEEVVEETEKQKKKRLKKEKKNKKGE